MHRLTIRFGKITTGSDFESSEEAVDTLRQARIQKGPRANVFGIFLPHWELILKGIAEKIERGETSGKLQAVRTTLRRLRKRSRYIDDPPDRISGEWTFEEKNAQR